MEVFSSERFLMEVGVDGQAIRVWLGSTSELATAAMTTWAHVYADSRISIEFTQTLINQKHFATYCQYMTKHIGVLLFKSTAGIEGIGSPSKSFSVQRCSLFLCQKGCMDRSFANLWWMLAWNWGCCSCFCLCTSIFICLLLVVHAVQLLVTQWTSSWGRTGKVLVW